MGLLTLLSWNVNGIRAVSKKGFSTWLETMAPDILCLQEIKADESQLPPELAQPEGYHAFWNSAKSKKGYSGTAIFSREKPLEVEYDLGLETFDWPDLHFGVQQAGGADNLFDNLLAFV